MDNQQVKVIATDGYNRGSDCGALHTLSSLADSRADIKDVEAGISTRLAITDESRTNGQFHLLGKIFDNERSNMQTKFDSVTATKDLEIRTNDKISDLKLFMSEKLNSQKDSAALATMLEKILSCVTTS